jgi:hypothetical protein
MVGSQAAAAAGLVACEADKLLMREGWWYHGLPPFCRGESGATGVESLRL